MCAAEFTGNDLYELAAEVLAIKAETAQAFRMILQNFFAKVGAIVSYLKHERIRTRREINCHHIGVFCAILE